LADKLREMSLVGTDSDYANHVLDTVILILNQATNYYLEHGGQNLVEQVDGFIDNINGQNLASDNIHSSTQSNKIQLLTPSSALGYHFDEVFVVEVNDSIWPNLKLRGQIVKSALLRDILMGKIGNVQQWKYSEEIRSVRASELRLFYTALTRATNATYILCSQSEESLPSTFLDSTSFETRQIAGTVLDNVDLELDSLVKNSPTLTDVVNNLRAQLLISSLQQGETTSTTLQKRLLKTLESEALQTATPATWYYSKYTTDTPTFGEILLKYHNGKLRLSPSAVETLVQCPLSWYFNARGGQGPRSTKALLGELIHYAAEQVPNLVADAKFSSDADSAEVSDSDDTYQELLKAFNSRLEELELEKMAPLERRQLQISSQKLLKRIVQYYNSIKLAEPVSLPKNSKTDKAEKNAMMFTVALDTDSKPRVEEKISATLTKYNYQGQEIEVVLSGKIDRIESVYKVSNNADLDSAEHLGYRVVDWKTGKYPWKPKDESDSEFDLLTTENLQILSYQIMLNQYESKKDGQLVVDIPNLTSTASQGGALVYLGVDASTKRLVEQVGIRNLKSVVDQLVQYVERIISSSSFEAVANTNCRTCASKNSCPIRDEGRWLFDG
jgi:ATP-dependent exoDNAse (exonuclease V) beta subunit